MPFKIARFGSGFHNICFELKPYLKSLYLPAVQGRSCLKHFGYRNGFDPQILEATFGLDCHYSCMQ